MDEQTNLAHMVAEVVDRAIWKIKVILLRYSMDKPESFYVRVLLFAGKKEDDKSQQVVYVNYNLEEFIHLLDIMNSVYDEVITNPPICNVLLRVISSFYSSSFFFFSSQDNIEEGR